MDACTVLPTCYQNNSFLARETIKAKFEQKKETREEVYSPSVRLKHWSSNVNWYFEICKRDTDATKLNILSNLSVSRLQIVV